MILPPLGLTYNTTITVDEHLVVPRLPAAFPAMADMPPVFATAYMIAFAEAACIEALAPYLEEGEATVGTFAGLSHWAATPIGYEVKASVELIAISGRLLRFNVICRDEVDIIGEGLHERTVIDRQRFIDRVYAKLGYERAMMLAATTSPGLISTAVREMPA